MRPYEGNLVDYKFEKTGRVSHTRGWMRENFGAPSEVSIRIHDPPLRKKATKRGLLQAVDFAVLGAEVIHVRLPREGLTCRTLAEFGEGELRAVLHHMVALPVEQG